MNTPRTHPALPDASRRDRGDGTPWGGGAPSDPAPGTAPLPLLRKIRTGWWLPAATMILGGAVALAVVLRVVPVYRAAAWIEAQVRGPQPQHLPGEPDDDRPDAWESQIIESRIAWMHGRAIRDRALEMGRQGLPGRTAERWTAFQETLPSITIIRREQTRLARIEAVGADPDMTAAAVNLTAQAIIEASSRRNQENVAQATAWLVAQIEPLGQRLEQAEQAVYAFQAENGIDLADVRKTVIEDRLIDLHRELTEAENQAAKTRNLADLLRFLRIQPEQSARLPDAVQRRTEILEIVARWENAVRERQAMDGRYTERHPDLIAHDQRVREDRQEAIDAIEKARENASANFVLAQQQVNTLQRRIEQTNADAADLDERQARLRAHAKTLEHLRDTAEMEYRGLLNRIEATRLAADANSVDTQLVEPAGVPSQPLPARMIGRLVSGAILGGAGGLLLIMLGIGQGISRMPRRNQWDKRLDSPGPVLARIPHAAQPGGAALVRLGIEQSEHPLLDSVAALQTTLDDPDRIASTSAILIAGVLPGEGKTVIAANLAALCARAGRRTLLVDFDPRRPRLRQIFNVPEPVAGLDAIMATQHHEPTPTPTAAPPCPPKVVEQYLGLTRPQTAWLIEGTTLSIAGNRAATPFDEPQPLAPDAIRRLVDWATAAYDQVIFIAPPTRISGEAMALARLVPGTLFVCRPSVTPWRALRNTLNAFRQTGANVIGVVVNQA